MWISRSEFDQMVERIDRLEKKAMELDWAANWHEGVYANDIRQLKVLARNTYSARDLIGLLLEHLKLYPNTTEKKISLETKGGPEKG
jgi:hypothetical protein